jgi:hypothetical protein
MICKLIDAGQKANKLASYIASKAIGLAADFGLGAAKIDRKQLPWIVRALRAQHGQSTACEVRHVVSSVPKGTPRKVAITLLWAVWLDWIATYAPGRPWVAAIQIHNGIYHLHGGVANVGPDGKPLKFKPYMVRDMAAMKFTAHTISAKGAGKSRGVAVYPKARKLAVRDLAAFLIDDNGVVRPERWDALVASGDIGDLRLRKDGSLISFSYQGCRIGFDTLQSFIAQQQTQQKEIQQPMIAEISLTQPPPLALVADLEAVGIDKQTLDAMWQKLNVAHGYLQKKQVAMTPTKSKNIQQDPPL